MVSKSLVSFYVLRFLSVNKRGRVRGGGHVSYPPPNRFMMAPVSILDGGAEERMGAEELNTSAGGGKVEIMFLDPKHAQIHTKHTHTHTETIHYNAQCAFIKFSFSARSTCRNKKRGKCHSLNASDSSVAFS